MNKVVITITSEGNMVDVSAEYSPDYPDDTPASELPPAHQLAVMLMGDAAALLDDEEYPDA